GVGSVDLLRDHDVTVQPADLGPLPKIRKVGDGRLILSFAELLQGELLGFTIRITQVMVFLYSSICFSKMSASGPTATTFRSGNQIPARLPSLWEPTSTQTDRLPYIRISPRVWPKICGTPTHRSSRSASRHRIPPAGIHPPRGAPMASTTFPSAAFRISAISS